jgi:hypothetical protein
MNDEYKEIQNKDDYKKVLSSGVFSTQFPELKGEWREDKLIILQGEHEDQKGDIWDFPIEVIDKMAERQIEAGNEYNVGIFQRDKVADDKEGGFYWRDTEEGGFFWQKVMCEKDFDYFFEKYPREVKEIQTVNDYIEQLKGKYIDKDTSKYGNPIERISHELQDQGIKVNEGKLSYSEVCPVYIASMAKRMSSNKEQYPRNNWKKEIDPLELLDAMERHICDLKLLLNREQPIHNTAERELDHLAAIGCDAQMISYQLNKKQ